MGAHREARLDLIVEIAGRIGRIVRHIHGRAPHQRQQPHRPRPGCDDIGLDFGDQQVRPLGELDRPGIGPTIAGEHKAQAIPVEPVSRSAIADMRLLPMPDGDPVLLVSDAAVVLVIELLHIELETLSGRQGLKILALPGQHLLHPVHHVARAQLGRSARWPVDPQLLVPASAPRTKGVGIGHRGDMIPVQVSQEDVIEPIERHPSGKVIRDRAGPEIEYEALTVAQFDIDRRAHLAGADQRRGAHEGDPHLVGLERFGLGIPVHRVLEPRHRFDPGEIHPFGPAPERLSRSRHRVENLGVGFNRLIMRRCAR